MGDKTVSVSTFERNTSMVQFKSDMTVELTDSMGGDESIVRFARVSSGSVGTEKSDRGLIRMLMRDRHGSPFEAPILQFRVECPIFVAREFFRHRIASYNEVSGRYQELTPVFYVPEKERPLKQLGKPGAYTFESGTYQQQILTEGTHKRAAIDAWSEYEYLLDHGIAREVARNVLPLSIYTSFYVNFNLRSALNFLSLRLEHEASVTPTFPLQEIQAVANKMDSYAQQVAPVAMAAFTEFGRVAP
jgi:thymidylate synthase (FAD)